MSALARFLDLFRDDGSITEVPVDAAVQAFPEYAEHLIAHNDECNGMLPVDAVARIVGVKILGGHELFWWDIEE